MSGGVRLGRALGDNHPIWRVTIFPAPNRVQQKFGADQPIFLLELLTGGGQGRITEA